MKEPAKRLPSEQLLKYPLQCPYCQIPLKASREWYLNHLIASHPKLVRRILVDNIWPAKERTKDEKSSDS
jgi:hypothetical protein